jgi:heptosyltransferase II
MEAGTVPHVNRLVIVAPNWLGDAVMALPAIADVRRAWPGVRIAIAARPSIGPLFTLAAGVDDVIALHAASDRRDPIDQLREQAFDAALLLTNSFHTALLARRAGIAERWGYRADWRGPLLTRAIARPAGLHQTAFYQRLVEQLGFENGPMEPQIAARPDVLAAGAAALTAAGWDGSRPLVAIAPGAAYGAAKRWPARSFAAVASALVSRDAVGIVLVGSAGDARAGAEVEHAAMIAPLNLIGCTDLSTLAGVLMSCRGLVTNDSGAMHLAAALGVSVTAMFGPTDERETSPLGSAAPVVLVHDVWCRPCMLRECPLVHRCMRGIAVDDVLTAARRTL